MKINKNYDEFIADVGSRLRLFIMRTGMNQSEFAEMVALKQASLSKVVNGKGGMSSDLVFQLCKKFDIDWNWLILGMNNESIESKEEKSAFIDTTMNHYEREIQLLKEQLKLKDEIIFLLKNQRI